MANSCFMFNFINEVLAKWLFRIQKMACSVVQLCNFYNGEIQSQLLIWNYIQNVWIFTTETCSWQCSNFHFLFHPATGGHIFFTLTEPYLKLDFLKNLEPTMKRYEDAGHWKMIARKTVTNYAKIFPGVFYIFEVLWFGERYHSPW